MVMISNKGKIDFSFIPSLECNIECPFCMYDSGINKTDKIDIKQTKKFIDTIDWRLINSLGFYGGEPSINIDLYSEIIELLPEDIPKFVISNGTWTANMDHYFPFMYFVNRYKLHLVISGTDYHKKFQDQNIIQSIRDLRIDWITLKDDDDIQPMGRSAKDNWSCTQKCLKHDKPMRLGLFPNGDILYQNCDGVYPVVQDFYEPLKSIDEINGIILNKVRGRMDLSLTVDQV